MNTFINESVRFLCEKHKEKISDVNILLPSKRSQLFFNIELSTYFKGKAIWQPKFLSIDNLCEGISNLKLGNKIKLIIELYEIYKTFHDEKFDQFYNWGEMIIADFDAIDNYNLDAKQVFCNISDLYEIDAIYDDIAQEQREIINNFWKIYSTTQSSGEKENFQKIWNTLFDIYTQFNNRLKQIGIGYKGMIYRLAAKTLKNEPENRFKGEHYAVIGFNALSNSEKVIFDKIKESKNADFLWDYDKYYIEDRNHEAGIFIRENINRYGDSAPVNKNNYTKEKIINIINSPSDALQCKYVWQFLQDCNKKAILNGNMLNKETAIILTDESMLLPILYSIPKEIQNFNITAGYPITQTTAFTLFEYLIRLFINCKAENNIPKHHKDTILTILNHPIISSVIQNDDNVKLFANNTKLSKNRFIQFHNIEVAIIDKIFNIDTTEHISQYLMQTLNIIGKEYYNVEEDKINLEFMYKVVQEIEQTNNIFKQTNFIPSNNIYVSAVRKHLQSTTIPFNGEPLVGIQIMGILETRNIDFENVLILSMNDDNYPSSSVRKSFIPHALRVGHSLPTYSYQEAMYTYYFYRLIQRAKRVDIAYCSSSEGVKNGEVSRYVHQMRYEKNHPLTDVALSLNVNINERENEIKKDSNYFNYIELLTSKQKTISPSAIDNWINCQAKFYYKYILKIEAKPAIENTLSAMDLGNAVHYILDQIYKKAIGKSNKDTKKYLSELLTTTTIINLTNKWIEDNYPDKLELGTTSTTKKFILSYIKSILKYDINRTDDFIIKATEYKISTDITINSDTTIKLYGEIDRIDSSGSIDMITDYKTGKQDNSAQNIISLFDSETLKINKPFLQSLIYCYMYSSNENREVFPSLYFARDMVNKDYQNRLILKDRGLTFTIDSFRQVEQELIDSLKQTLLEIIDKESTIKKTTVANRCDYCDYKTICMR